MKKSYIKINIDRKKVQKINLKSRKYVGNWVKRAKISQKLKKIARK